MLSLHVCTAPHRLRHPPAGLQGLHNRGKDCCLAPAPPPPCRFSGAAPAAPGSFAFGAKYVSQVASVLPPGAAGGGGSAAAAGDAIKAAIIPADLDGELSQQLQKLSKRDATTKLKALQVKDAAQGTAGSTGCGRGRQAALQTKAAAPEGATRSAVMQRLAAAEC